MQIQTTNLDLSLTARDVSGQRAFALRRLPAQSSVGDLVRKLVGRLGLTTEDAGGRPTTYRAFLQREGRHLHASERVADTLRPDDELVIQPDIQAGAAGTRRRVRGRSLAPSAPGETGEGAPARHARRAETPCASEVRRGSPLALPALGETREGATARHARRAEIPGANDVRREPATDRRRTRG